MPGTAATTGPAEGPARLSGVRFELVSSNGPSNLKPAHFGLCCALHFKAAISTSSRAMDVTCTAMLKLGTEERLQGTTNHDSRDLLCQCTHRGEEQQATVASLGSQYRRVVLLRLLLLQDEKR